MWEAFRLSSTIITIARIVRAMGITAKLAISPTNSLVVALYVSMSLVTPSTDDAWPLKRNSTSFLSASFMARHWAR